MSMKKAIILLFITFSAVFLPTPVRAADAAYQLLAPLPYISDLNPTGTLKCEIEGTKLPCSTANTFIPGFVRLIIALAGLAAVVKIIISGIQYMSTDAFTGKNDAKKGIQDALIGLLLAIGAFLILNTINPDLVSTKLKLPVITRNTTLDDIKPCENEGGTVVDDVCRNADGTTSDGKVWASDHDLKQQLRSKGVDVADPSCAYLGALHCTSVTGLSSTIADKLISFSTDCKKKNSACAVKITGGTEYWLHGDLTPNLTTNKTDHKPQELEPADRWGAVDLSSAGTVSDYIRKNLKTTSQDTCIHGNFERYVSSDSKTVYVYETVNDGNSTGNHWHVCFYR
jgi:hypothetical protein